MEKVYHCSCNFQDNTKIGIIKPFFLLLTVLLLCAASKGYAQQTDTLQLEPYWSEYAWGLRVGLHYQKAIASEIGVSYHRTGGDIVSPAAQNAYLAVEWVPKILPVKERDIVAFKAGYELTGHLMVGALEVKYQSDFKKREDFVITPKLGLGGFGWVNLLYGYNISIKDYPFEELGKHQFSLVCNINRFMF